MEKTMKDIVRSIRTSIQNKNWYSALITSLIVPDICGKIQYPNKQSKERYIEWLNEYLSVSYRVFLTATDCYALRCSFLHEGSDNITSQEARRVLDNFILMSNPHFHCNYIDNSGKKSLQLDVGTFCEDMCLASEVWMQAVSSDIEIQDRMLKVLKIYTEGENVPGFIKYH
jgi:hypothetical protein